MALGHYIQRGSITTNTDTVVPGTPVAGERVYVLWMTFTVSVAGTTSRIKVSDTNASGAVLARLATTTADAILSINYTTANPNYPGNALAIGSGLNINTSGGAAATIDYEVCYMIKG